MHKIRLICFDFDGTIADTMPVLESNAVKLFLKYHPELGLEKARNNYRSTTGLPFEQQVELIFPRNVTNHDLIEEFEKLKLETIFDQHLFNETTEVLSKLKSKKFLIAISSSTYKEIITEYLNKNGVLKLIDTVLGYRPGFEKGKDHFNFLKEKYELNSKSILFIGDSLKDMERAFLSQVNFIGRTSIMNKAEDFVYKTDNDSKIKYPTINNLTGIFQFLNN
ncbi:MAG: HAD family hydrolase [Candidatus Thorarchaeota archaeon]